MGAMLFHSCDEEWNRWEVTNVEMNDTLFEHVEIPFEGGHISIPFKTNTVWMVSSNQKWITFNQNSGKGDATIEATIAANTEKESRSGRINIVFGDLNGQNEILGTDSKSVSFTQHSEYEDMVSALSLTIDNNSRVERIYGGNMLYRKIMVSYYFQYRESEDLNNIQEASLNFRYLIKRIDRQKNHATGVEYDETDQYVIPESEYNSETHQYVVEKNIGKYINDRYVDECSGVYCTPVIKLKDGKEIKGRERFLTTYAL